MSKHVQAALSRRKFLGLSALGAGLLVANPQSLLAGPKSTVSTGLQLYTVRDMMAKNVPQTLELVANVGYKELEFAGYFDHKPAELRKILDDLGLSAPSAHLPLEVFQTELDAALEAALILGHKYLVVPWLSVEQRGTKIDTYKQLAEHFNRWGEKCAKVGVTFGYHNHDFEFQTTDGQTPYDVLLAETDPSNVIMELDLYWTVKAERDPVEYFRKHPGRFPLWHIKDMDKEGNFADVGKGVIDFKRIFAAADVAGLKHEFVERDHTDDPVRTIRQGYQAMQKLLNAQAAPAESVNNGA